MRFSGILVIIIALAVSVLLISNTFAGKPIYLFDLGFDFLGGSAVIVSVSVICFPIGYIISDVLTEVYGFRVARGVIWLGFVCNLLMVFLYWLGGEIPGPGFYEGQSAYDAILGTTGWLLLGSFAAYVIGEFTNATVMVVLKNKTEGRMLWLRAVASTIVGQGVDSWIFYLIAFGASGLWTWEQAAQGAIFGWIVKTLFEVAALPFTYAVVGWLKRRERMDIYEPAHSLNPFGIFGSPAPDARNAALEGGAAKSE